MRDFLRNFFFGLIITVLFFLGLEAAYRVNVAVKTHNPAFLYFGKSMVELRVKMLSERVDSFFHKKNNVADNNAEGVVLSVFGGSTTRCTPWVEAKDSWPKRLEYHLSRSLNTDVRVDNNGLPGITLAYCSRLFKNYLMMSKNMPSAVIFHIGINDAAQIVFESHEDVVHVPILQRINSTLMGTSLLYVAIKEKYFLLTKKDITKAWTTDSDTAHKIRKTGSKAVFKTPEQFRKDLANLVQTAKDFKVRLVISAEPYSRAYAKKFPAFDSAFNKLVSIMQETADNGRVEFINMREEVFSRYPDFENCFIDDCHLNEIGNDFVAKIFAEYVVKYKNIAPVAQMPA